MALQQGQHANIKLYVKSVSLSSDIIMAGTTQELLWCTLNWVGLFVLAMSVGVYILQHIYCAFFYRTQNLKKKYNAQWALVTGSSTGEHGWQCAAFNVILELFRARTCMMLTAHIQLPSFADVVGCP